MESSSPITIDVYQMNYTIREIQPADNFTIAEIIRSVLTEFNANLPGTVYYDPSIYKLYEDYQQQGPKARYFVAEINKKLVGGSGIGTLAGEENVCELQKLYLLPEGRGTGLGKALIEKCLQFAKEAGYQQCYLESLPELSTAVKLYEKLGFSYLKQPMGQTGHNGCSLWMIRNL